MNAATLLRMLESVAAGETAPERALEKLAWLPVEDVGAETNGTAFARLDHHRELRLGHPEVVFCEGKTTEQVTAICERLAALRGGFLATRAGTDAQSALAARFPDAIVNEIGRVVYLPGEDAASRAGTRAAVAVVSAGTADLPVAEEAAACLAAFGHEARRVYDVGVAGLHRLLRESGTLREANVVIVVAGMEGALPSVLGGLIGAPVVAVPTSVGYGASFGGLAALLGMLNSCAPGVTVVNIDNGFGAACAAARIGRLLERRG